MWLEWSMINVTARIKPTLDLNRDWDFTFDNKSAMETDLSETQNSNGQSKGSCYIIHRQAPLN